MPNDRRNQSWISGECLFLLPENNRRFIFWQTRSSALNSSLHEWRQANDTDYKIMLCEAPVCELTRCRLPEWVPLKLNCFTSINMNHTAEYNHPLNPNNWTVCLQIFYFILKNGTERELHNMREEKWSQEWWLRAMCQRDQKKKKKQEHFRSDRPGSQQTNVNDGVE